MFRKAEGTRVAVVVLLALVLIALLLLGGTIYAQSDVLALRPGESMVVYCFDLDRAEAAETFRGGIIIWCPADKDIHTYLPVVIQGVR